MNARGGTRRGVGRGRVASSIAVALAVVCIGVSCRQSSGTTDEGAGTGSSTISNNEASVAGGDFGDLKNVCQGGSAKGATAQGVTDTGIQVGTLTDFGFTQVREFIDAAEAFTSWCNDAGGVNGRKLTANIRDTKIFEYRQRILDACQQDFALVGGGGAFDDSGVNDRLSCLLPDFPAQVLTAKNRMSDLQVISYFNYNPKLSPYEDWFRWLTTEKFPDSKNAVGMILGDVGVLATVAQQNEEAFKFLGATLTYNEKYPILGASDWAPYAQSIKSTGTKGLVFYGEYKQLAKLEQALADINYKLDWIDANSNSYNRDFIDLTGSAIDQNTNLIPSGVYPLEQASQNPATEQIMAVFAKYKPNVAVTAPMVNAWSSWLRFATAVRDCGSTVTRRCVYDKAITAKDWTGGGLHAPIDLTTKDSKTSCFVAEQASSSGWTSVDSGANKGVYRCKDLQYRLTGTYDHAVTLADVGKSMADVK